ncbi:MAG: hypothetical protein HY319_15010 [Armatimonadetes bacterium]|nr:hypothetical protein [Armatimonadota bacterium]
MVTAILAMGGLSLVAAYVFAARVRSISIAEGAATPEEADRLAEIAGAISEGANAFLMREYRSWQPSCSLSRWSSGS